MQGGGGGGSRLLNCLPLNPLKNNKGTNTKFPSCAVPSQSIIKHAKVAVDKNIYSIIAVSYRSTVINISNIYR